MSRADDLQERTDVFRRPVHRGRRSASTNNGGAMSRQAVPGCIDVRGRHYRAARHGRSYAEFTSKIGVVAEEADESVFWLNRIEKALAATGVAIEPLLAEAEETRSNLQRRRADARYRRGRK
jgi:hypothetical protein